MPELILTAELVPSTSWYDNLRKVLSPEDWDSIRFQVYEHFGNRCALCEAAGSLHCHEIWRYDDAKHLQTLDGFYALCPWCHHIKHLGYAGILADQGKLDYERLIRHFQKVNGCDRQAFLLHRNEAFDQWERRSKFNWTVELGEYASWAVGRV